MNAGQCTFLLMAAVLKQGWWAGGSPLPSAAGAGAAASRLGSAPLAGWAVTVHWGQRAVGGERRRRPKEGKEMNSGYNFSGCNFSSCSPDTHTGSASVNREPSMLVSVPTELPLPPPRTDPSGRVSGVE